MGLATMTTKRWSRSDKALVTERLKGLERAYRIAPDGARFETMQVLMADGVDSAQRVRVMGKSAFKAPPWATYRGRRRRR